MAKSPRQRRAPDPAPAPKPSVSSRIAARFDGFGHALSILAVWAVVAASTILNAWGWLQSTAGLIAGVVVALVIASEILGATLLPQIMRALDARNLLRAALAAVLFAGVVVFNGYSGHRAFEMIEAARVAPEQAKARADALIVERQRRLDAVAPVQLTDEQGRPIGPQRLEILKQQRDADVARLTAELAEAKQARAKIATSVSSTVPPMNTETLWALVVLIEGLKAGALFALARPTQRPPKRRAADPPEAVAQPVEPPAVSLEDRRAARSRQVAQPPANDERPELVAPSAQVATLPPVEPAPVAAPRPFMSARERLEAMKVQRSPPPPVAKSAAVDGPSIRQRGRMGRRAGLDQAAAIADEISGKPANPSA